MDKFTAIEKIIKLRATAKELLDTHNGDYEKYLKKLREWETKINGFSGSGSNGEICRYTGRAEDDYALIDKLFEELQSLYEEISSGRHTSSSCRKDYIHIYSQIIATLKDRRVRIREIEGYFRAKFENGAKELVDEAVSYGKEVASIPRKNIKSVPKITSEVKEVKGYEGEAFITIGEYVASEASKSSDYVLKMFDDEIAKIVANTQTSNLFELPLSAQGEGNNLLIYSEEYSHDEAVSDAGLLSLLKQSVYHFINALPRAAKRICCVQSRRISQMQGFLTNLYSDKYKELIWAQADDDGVDVIAEDPLPVLERLIEDVRLSNALLPLKGETSVYNYNKNNYRNGIWQPQTLLIIKDFPNGFDEKRMNYLGELLQCANAAGITVILLVCKDLLKKRLDRYPNEESYFSRIESLFNRSFDVKGDRLIDCKTGETVKFNAKAFDKGEFDFIKYKENLSRIMQKKDEDPFIPLSSIFKKPSATDPKRREFSAVLQLPVGMKGTEIFSLDLHTNTDAAHTVVSGMTGSGKSVLLHDIILSAAYHYSPEEVELYLFDFKQTPGGFERYAEMKIPHIKTIAVNNNPYEVVQLLTSIGNVYKKRLGDVRKADCANIIEYNDKALKSGLKKIPRILIVIDEYHSISDAVSLGILEDIARKGREYGVNLIMASQKAAETNFSRIMAQFTHRFEFKNEPLGGLINVLVNRKYSLNGPQGMCYYAGGSGGTPIVVRTGYDGGTSNKDKYFREILENWRNFSSNTYLVGSVKDELKRKVDYDQRSGLFKPQQDRKTLRGEGAIEETFFKDAVEKFELRGDGSGFILYLGINGITLDAVRYNLDYYDPFLFVLGSRVRMANTQYSAVKSASLAGKKAATDFIYFFRDKTDDDQSPVGYLRKNNLKKTKFFSVKETEDGISELYGKYEERKNSGKYENPILVVFSDFYGSINAVLEEKTEKPKAFTPQQMREAAMAGANSFSDRKERSKKASDKLSELIFDGKSYGIFFVFCFADEDSVQATFKSLGRPQNVRSLLLVMDDRPNSGANVEQAFYFFYQRLAQTGYVSKEIGKLSVKFNYIVDKNNYLEFIPFEYKL